MILPLLFKQSESLTRLWRIEHPKWRPLHPKRHRLTQLAQGPPKAVRRPGGVGERARVDEPGTPAQERRCGDTAVADDRFVVPSVRGVERARGIDQFLRPVVRARCPPGL